MAEEKSTVYDVLKDNKLQIYFQYQLHFWGLEQFILMSDQI